MSALFDSTVLIAHLRGVAVATELLRSVVASGGASASVVSRAEIENGMRSDERRDVARLLASLQIVPVSDAIAAEAGRFLRRHRRSHPGVDLADYLVAATADVTGSPLLMLNTKHFPMFVGLRPAF